MPASHRSRSPAATALDTASHAVATAGSTRDQSHCGHPGSNVSRHRAGGCPFRHPLLLLLCGCRGLSNELSRGRRCAHQGGPDLAGSSPRLPLVPPPQRSHRRGPVLVRSLGDVLSRQRAAPRPSARDVPPPIRPIPPMTRAGVRRSPRVSIIVPAYNGEKYLGRTLDSVLAQTVTDWELIISDDGSTDETTAIAARHAKDDRRIRVVTAANGGVARARNRGLASERSRFRIRDSPRPGRQVAPGRSRGHDG